MNEVELENQTHKATLEDFKTRFSLLQTEHQASERKLQEANTHLEDTNSKLQASTQENEEATKALQDTEGRLSTMNETCANLKSRMEAMRDEYQSLQVDLNTVLICT